MPSYKQALEEANKLFRKHGKETSAAKLLLLHFSHLEPSDLYLNYTELMPEDYHLEFLEAVRKHLDLNIPVQHIIGYVYFYGYKFIVNDQVLIPRFETEELVANILMLYDEYFDGKAVDLVDIGTGSGCLAISLQKEEAQKFKVVATDISESAVEVARKNAEINAAEIEFVVGDMLKPLAGRRFDILVSNPPYIPQDEAVDNIIYDNEPHIALFGGADGLRFYREILQGAKSIIKDQAIIAFEHGFDKADQLRDIAKTYFPDAKIYTLKDMQKLDRMTFVIQGFVNRE